ncbi:YibE/F family protein [Bacillus sp. AFS040349]|uniref:YibE/F family protein n=1 Tax=Bacillus sp. AFS040349 TaxID=2033502 RepID=UPI000BFD7924|nr:YibE/F family protein [Bacillus sp. AFS040349]PGT82784.1 yibE/F-like family protein [Bacillus sp. AFS040349]
MFRQIIFYTLLVFFFIVSMFFVYNNYSFYDQPIAKITKTHLVESTETVDPHENVDKLFTQHIEAVIKNGEHRGETISLTNEYSSSGAYDQKFEAGNELFISLDTEESSTLTGTIKDVKRDKYVVFIAWIFIFTLLIVGKKQGLFSIISLAVNAVLLSYALDVYMNTSGVSLLVVCGISAILFTIISLLLVNGFNGKTYAAVISTILGTFISLLIAIFVMWVTAEEGLRYEEMQFLTRPPQTVFIAGVLIGSLGAVMDVAITMSSSVYGLYEENHNISIKALKKSGMDIGKDIMGTMTNILFFAYVSGAIPMLILYFKNSSPLTYTLSINLSLELARALAGGIGIVLTIPIGLYTSILFINLRKRTKS